jgi:hypothetical protein
MAAICLFLAVLEHVCSRLLRLLRDSYRRKERNPLVTACGRTSHQLGDIRLTVREALTGATLPIEDTGDYLWIMLPAFSELAIIELTGS